MGGKAAIACVVLVLTAGCGGAGSTPQAHRPRAVASEGEGCPDAVPWREAAMHVGEHLTMAGPVRSASYHPESKGAPTFLNIGRDYPDPDRFTVVIFGDARGRFAASPEDTFGRGTVCVTGEVADYHGVTEIVVEQPGQIRR